jgi:hypothetical protein
MLFLGQSQTGGLKNQDASVSIARLEPVVMSMELSGSLVFEVLSNKSIIRKNKIDKKELDNTRMPTIFLPRTFWAVEFPPH